MAKVQCQDTFLGFALAEPLSHRISRLDRANEQVQESEQHANGLGDAYHVRVVQMA